MEIGDMEIGDAAAWIGCAVATLSLAWHVANELRASAAGKRSLLQADVTVADNSRAFIEWRSTGIGDHTTAALRVKVRAPAKAQLIRATVTGPMDDLRFIQWGAPGRTLDLGLSKETDHLWGRIYVTGLETSETPFMLEVVLFDGGSGKPIMRRRKWGMQASRPGIKLEARHH